MPLGETRKYLKENGSREALWLRLRDGQEVFYMNQPQRSRWNDAHLRRCQMDTILRNVTEILN